MHGMNLRALDLNLLVVFDALMKEGGVSRTADRIGLSQPAVSHALQRLRTYFHDPLFVRSASGMRPTEKALELAPTVRDALTRIESVLDHGDAFDPAGASRTFTIGMSDYSGLILLPRLLRTFHEQSPDSVLHVRAINRVSGPLQLDKAEIDLVIGIQAKVSSAHRRAELFRDDWVAICWSEGPHAGAEFTAETYARADHLNVSTHGETSHYLDPAFTRLGLRRNIVASTSHFLLVPELIQGSSMIATVGRQLARHFAPTSTLTTKELPFLDDEFAIEMLWHNFATRIPANAWLRDLVLEAADAARFVT